MLGCFPEDTRTLPTLYDYRNVVFRPGILVKIAVGNFYGVPIY